VGKGGKKVLREWPKNEEMVQNNDHVSAKEKNEVQPRGQCYDHCFQRLLAIFGGKIGVFLVKNCYDPILQCFE
jgi:hypothetical protein